MSVSITLLYILLFIMISYVKCNIFIMFYNSVVYFQVTLFNTKNITREIYCYLFSHTIHNIINNYEDESFLKH